MIVRYSFKEECTSHFKVLFILFLFINMCSSYVLELFWVELVTLSSLEFSV